MTGNYPILPVYYSQSFLKKTQVSYLNYISITVSYVSALSYCSRTVANELEATFLTSPTTLTETADLNPNSVLRASRDLEEASHFHTDLCGWLVSLTAPADENKGNCILKQRPSRNPIIHAVYDVNISER